MSNSSPTKEKTTPTIVVTFSASKNSSGKAVTLFMGFILIEMS